jgi:hypothetical protein
VLASTLLVLGSIIEDSLETVDHGDYSDGSLFDLQNGPSSGAPFWFTRDNICNQQPQNHHQSPFPTQGGSGCPLCAYDPAVLASTLLVLGSIIEDMALFLAATRT